MPLPFAEVLAVYGDGNGILLVDGVLLLVKQQFSTVGCQDGSGFADTGSAYVCQYDTAGCGNLHLCQLFGSKEMDGLSFAKHLYYGFVGFHIDGGIIFDGTLVQSIVGKLQSHIDKHRVSGPCLVGKSKPDSQHTGGEPDGWCVASLKLMDKGRYDDDGSIACGIFKHPLIIFIDLNMAGTMGF